MRLIKRPYLRVLIYYDSARYFEYNAPWTRQCVELKSIYIQYIKYIYENY